MSPRPGERGQDKEACRVEGEGGHPAHEVQEGVISEHPSLLQQHREREGRSPATGLPPAPKETVGRASQQADNHEELVESILT